MDDLVKRVRRIGIGSELGATTRDRTTAQEAADRIEALEARNKLLEQSQAAQALAGLGVNVVAAHNSGLAALKAGCKEERLRAKKAEARIEALEALLEQRDAFIVSKDLWFEFVDSAAFAGQNVSRETPLRSRHSVPAEGPNGSAGKTPPDVA